MFYYVIFFSFFNQQKTDIIDGGKVPKSTQGVDKKEPTKQKTKAQYNYLLPNQVMNSTTEFVCPP